MLTLKVREITAILTLDIQRDYVGTGCLCIRNIAGRCPDLRQIILDAGVETILRKAGTNRYCELCAIDLNAYP